MPRGLTELANLINAEFTKKGDSEVLTGLRKQMVSTDVEENKAAFNTLKARGISITEEEFQTVREYTVFEAQKNAKMMKTTGYTYMIIGIALAGMSIYLRSRLTLFGLIAAILLFIVGFSSFKQGKNLY